MSNQCERWLAGYWKGLVHGRSDCRLGFVSARVDALRTELADWEKRLDAELETRRKHIQEFDTGSTEDISTYSYALLYALLACSDDSSGTEYERRLAGYRKGRVHGRSECRLGFVSARVDALRTELADWEKRLDVELEARRKHTQEFDTGSTEDTPLHSYALLYAAQACSDESRFRFPNGSEIIMGGVGDKANRLRGASADNFFIDEDESTEDSTDERS